VYLQERRNTHVTRTLVSLKLKWLHRQNTSIWRAKPGF